MDKKYNRLIPDKPNCSFWWICYLDMNNPDNRAKEIHGYSKFQYQSEAKNKEDVLMAKIEMLYKNGYLNRSTKIDIYKRVAPLPSINEDRLVLTLMPKDYIIPTNFINTTPWRVKQFLINFYDAVAHGRETKGLRPLPDKTQSKDDQFDITKHHFSSYSQLMVYAEKQLSNGTPADQVKTFMDKYIEKNFKNHPSSQLMQLYNMVKK
jgi:hypothetical protein